MDTGLAWIRRRHRSLGRAVLAIVCAAWLQAAIVPCVMAHGSGSPPAQAAASSHDGHVSHGGHEHAAPPAGEDEARRSPPCLYCPQGASGDESCDAHGGCSYLHDPQVDSRSAGVIFAAVPVSFVVSPPVARLIAHRVEHSLPDAVPRVSLSVSYCRFIE